MGATHATQIVRFVERVLFQHHKGLSKKS
jgi:hypothetical protein